MASKKITGPWSLAQYPAHLGTDAGIVVQPKFGGDASWFEAYGERHGAEGPINPPGVWHTADAEVPVTALFITSGLGTEHRPR